MRKESWTAAATESCNGTKAVWHTVQRLDQQVQRALNMDNFELAKALREERQSVDADLEDLQVTDSTLA